MKLDGLRQQVFLDRYSLKDKKGKPLEKTPDQMWKRVAKGISLVEKKSEQKKWEKKFYEIMEDFKFVPGGRVLAGAGTGYAVTFYNCFALPSPADSRDGILDNLKAMIEIMARGGGVGINLSSLRPKGARVKKVNGFSSGPCNWAEMYSLATHDIIQQGGSRRGALMLMLWDWHPDIEEFITVKQDLRRMNGANLSVCVSDKFMEMVKKDGNWDLVFPDLDDKEYDQKWDGVLEHWKKLGKKVKVYKTVKARYLWDLVCEAAWRSAEPGVVFMERYNKWYNNWYWNTVNCVNPCVTGDTLVATEKGQKKARDLKVGDRILTSKGFKPIKKFYNNGLQRIYEVLFSDGGSLRATVDHKLRVVRENGMQEWVKVSNLRKEDRVLKLVLFGSTDHSGKRYEKYRNQEQQYIDRKQQIGIKRSSISHSYNFAILANMTLNVQEKIASPVQTSIACQSILSTPASTGGRTAMAKTTWPIPAVISDSFLNSDLPSLNVACEGFRFLTTDISVPDGEVKASTVSVKKVKDTETEEEVFDVHEPETLTWVTNGYVSLDCGEEGLPAWGVCNLGSLNLAAFVRNYLVDKPGEMDYKSLSETAKTAVRFQDDVVSADKYIFPQIEEVQLHGERRIGLGTMGLGDALIKMHLRYGSPESLKVIDKIFKIIRDAAYEASVEIAKEKGAFPKFNAKKHLQGYFIKKLPKKIRTRMRKHGVRNSVILQEAPTGTTSLLAGVSSGIEPVYEFEFIRKDRLGEHKMYHSLYEEWKKAHPTTASGQVRKPDHFVSANDLTPKEHVEVQAVIQKYVDASISKTVNAPKNHTVLDVKNLYTLAYERGCKGITYMREGSREGILSRIEPPTPQTLPASQPSGPVVLRPEKVEGVTYKTQTPVGEAFVTINHDEKGEPFEVFITIGKSGSDVSAMAEALGRMVSLNLRLSGGISQRERVRQVVTQLIGIGGTRSIGFGKDKVRSLPDAVAKILAKHFNFVVNGRVEDKRVINGEIREPDGKMQEQGNGETGDKPSIVMMQQLTLSGQGKGVSTPIEEGESLNETGPPGGEASLPVEALATSLFDICPECGSGSLAYEEGCRKCYSCGYSEC